MLLDLTGAASDNKRTVQIPIEPNGNGLAVLSPQGGFFHTSMTSPVVKHKGVTLTHGEDYRYVYKSKDIRSKYKISAHASIMLLRNDLLGQIELTANFVGGPYRLYMTDYISDITSTEYLLSLYDIDSLLDIPEELPPKASILNMEAVSGGMMSSVQLVYSIGTYLKDYEADKEKPSTGYTWPDVTIEDLNPPLYVDISFDVARGAAIPIENLSQVRMGIYPLGAMPLGYSPQVQ